MKTVSTNSFLLFKISFHCFTNLLAPTLQGRKSKLESRKLRAMSMRVDPTYQRLEDLGGILHDNLRASSWANETNPIYDRVAASEVQNFIEITYESLCTDESEAKTEAAPTALGEINSKPQSYVNFNILSDVDKEVFKKGNQTPKTKIDLVKQLASEKQQLVKIKLLSLKALKMIWEMTYIRILVNPLMKTRKPLAPVVMQKWMIWVMMFIKTLPQLQ